MVMHASLSGILAAIRDLDPVMSIDDIWQEVCEYSESDEVLDTISPTYTENP